MEMQPETRQEAAVMALAAKRGDRPKGKLRRIAKMMFEHLTERELEEMASAYRRYPQAH
ncbi:MAG: DUF3008 family protein [Paracoccaceae bacterium]